jgi:hypothetical protein
LGPCRGIVRVELHATIEGVERPLMIALWPPRLLSQAEELVRSARLFLFDSLAQLWTKLLATGEVTMEARALARLAASHAVSSAVQAVDLMYVAGGATSIYVI